MPSWAWVVTDMDSWTQWQKARFNALTGLSCYGYYSVNRCSNVVSMPSRAYTSFLPVLCQSDWGFTIARVNALSGLYLISTVRYVRNYNETAESVNALSGLYLISTIIYFIWSKYRRGFVSMPSRAYTSFLRNMWCSGNFTKWKCQCPLGLIPHFYHTKKSDSSDTGKKVSMPSRAYTSFLRYPFKNLGFMRFTEPVFAGIYQNILTTAVFRAC